MGIKTSIEYCDSSCNVLVGCDGCELWGPTFPRRKRHCYAANLIGRYAGKKGWPEQFDRPQLFPERLKQALRWKDLIGTERPDKPWLNGLPRVIFLNDLSDSFTESVDVDWMLPYIPMMEQSPHVWSHLTKRPWRMREFFYALDYVPERFILGTTITARKYNAKSRLASLISLAMNLKAHIWLSIEPMLEEIDLDRAVYEAVGRNLSYVVRRLASEGKSLFVACGGESGHNRRLFKPDRARKLRDQCQAAGIPFFMKQTDKVIPIPDDLMIREVPKWE